MKLVRCITALIVSAVLVSCSSKPMPEALLSLDGAVKRDKYYFFAAEDPITDTCYIYYPGGLVHAEAYAPYVAAVAARGVPAFLLRLRFDMAMWDADAADHAKQSEFAGEFCQRYVLGGHSLGGIGIALYAKNHPDDGLLFISAYAHKDGLVNNHQAPIMMVYGSNDTLSTEEEIMEASINVPDTAQYIKIEGGNHAQMGHYGPQNRDGEATISREQQQQLLVQHTLDLVKQMSAGE